MNKITIMRKWDDGDDPTTEILGTIETTLQMHEINDLWEKWNQQNSDENIYPDTDYEFLEFLEHENLATIINPEAVLVLG